MSIGLGLRARFLAVIVILAAAAIAAGLMTFERLRAKHHQSAPAPARPRVHGGPKPSRPGPVKLLKPGATATPKPGHPVTGTVPAMPGTVPPGTSLGAGAPPGAGSSASPSVGAAPGPSASVTPKPDSGLPAAVARQLAANRVVVVSLYAPKAKVDATAMREASAGAALAGAAFVAVDVTTSQIDGLNRRYGVIQDPAVLVLRPPGDLIVRIDGFADRDTVAQAAANASSQ